MFQPGDRVRWEATDDNGLPIVRYGFVGGCAAVGDQVVVMCDGELKGEHIVDLDRLAPVEITSVELRLEGTDLLDDPSLRQGLVHLWTAEADQAGLEICSLHPLGTGVHHANGSVALAELFAGGHRFVLKASYIDANTTMVKAEIPRHPK